MTRRQATYAAAVAAGARVRAAGRYLTCEAIRRDPTLRDLIRTAGWSAVWGGAVQGWAAENRRRAPSNQEQDDQGQGVRHE